MQTHSLTHAHTRPHTHTQTEVDFINPFSPSTNILSLSLSLSLSDRGEAYTENHGIPPTLNICVRLCLWQLKLNLYAAN